MSSKTPLTQHTYEVIHEQLRQFVLTEVFAYLFPKLAMDLKKVEATPIIIGGSALGNCTKLNTSAKKFMEDLFTEDIDVKIVITKEIQDNTDPIVPKIEAIREKFMNKVAKKLQSHIKKDKAIKDSGWTVTAEVSDALSKVNVEIMKRRRVTAVNLLYTNGTQQMQLPIVEMSLFSNYSASHYSQYRDLHPSETSPTIPVPFIKEKGVLYSSCDYAYYDTVRMLVDRGQYFEKTRNMYALLKLTRYIIKFIALYTLLKSKTVKTQAVSEKLEKIYDHAHSILQAISKTKTALNSDQIKKVTYDTPYVSNLKRLITRAVHVTDINDLVKLVKSIPELPPAKTQAAQAAGGASKKTVRRPRRQTQEKSATLHSRK